MSLRVLTMGTFDLVHPAHIALFAICRKLAQGGQVIAAVNTDAFVSSYKHTATAWTYERREEQVGRWADKVIPNDGTDQPGIIATVRPAILVIGSDWAPPKDYYAQIGVDQAFLDVLGVTVCYVPRTGDWSSTALKARA